MMELRNQPKLRRVSRGIEEAKRTQPRFADWGCSPKVTFIFRIHKPEVIFFIPKIMCSLLLSFLIKNMFIFFNISAFLAFSCGLKFIK